MVANSIASDREKVFWEEGTTQAKAPGKKAKPGLGDLCREQKTYMQGTEDLRAREINLESGFK